MQQTSNTRTIQRLTALWGLCESGLGGWMHALHIPLTGFLVGGFAVVVVGLLAHYSRNNMRIMLQSLVLVLLIKAAASPQSPPPAYIAVAFQGLIGAVLYRVISNYSVASILFAIIAMLESALQKLLIMTILFGKSLWNALDASFEGIVKDFHLPGDMPFSFWVIVIYSGIYVLWGLIIGIWVSGLPKKLDTYSEKLVLDVKAAAPSLDNVHAKRPGKLGFIFFTLVFIVFVLLYQQSFNKALYVILRTIAVLLLIFGIINPLVKWLMQRWLRKTTSKHGKQLQPLLDMLPELRSYIRPAWQMAGKEYSGLKRYSSFLFFLIVLTLQDDPTGHIHTEPANS